MDLESSPTLRPKASSCFPKPKQDRARIHHKSRSLLSCVRLERVAQAVADEAKAKHRQSNAQDWNQTNERRLLHVLCALGDHLPPAWDRVLNAEAKKAQSSLAEDGS